MLEDRSLHGLEDTLFRGIRLGRHPQHVEHSAILFVMIGHRRRQFFANPVPERLDALPERSAKQWIEEIAAEREGHQFRRGGGNLVRTAGARPQLPDRAPLGRRGCHIQPGRLQCLQVAPHTPRVQGGQPQVADQIIAQLLQRPPKTIIFQDLQNLVLPNQLLVPRHSNLASLLHGSCLVVL